MIEVRRHRDDGGGPSTTRAKGERLGGQGKRAGGSVPGGPVTFAPTLREQIVGFELLEELEFLFAEALSIMEALALEFLEARVAMTEVAHDAEPTSAPTCRQ
jgi:hypothetical protein